MPSFMGMHSQVVYGMYIFLRCRNRRMVCCLIRNAYNKPPGWLLDGEPSVEFLYILAMDGMSV